MPTVEKIPVSRHVRRRDARNRAASIRRLQMIVADVGDAGLRWFAVPDRADGTRLRPTDRIEVERLWPRLPVGAAVVAYRVRP